jgi:hypothetical protein
MFLMPSLFSGELFAACGGCTSKGKADLYGQQDYAIQILKRAEADASSLEPGMRAWVLLQVAHIYQPTDRRKSLRLLHDAFNATRGMADDQPNEFDEAMSRILGGPQSDSSRSHLQKQILQSIIALAPTRVNELLKQVDRKGRTMVLTSLLEYYQTNKQTEQALRVINRIAAETEMPYDAATRIMGAMKRDRSSDLQALFSASLSSYRDNAPHRNMADDSFPRMVTQFWSRVPEQVVRQAIDEILKQTDEPKNSNDTPKATFSIISSEKGQAVFDSLFQYRLFQILPVLREIDPSAAEGYLKKYTELAKPVQQFPNGDDSIPRQSPSTPPSGRNAGSKFSLSPGGSTGNLAAAVMEIPRAEKLVSDAAAGRGTEAIANAGNIGSLNIRAQCYEGIARVTQKKQSSIATSAITKMLDTADSIELPQQFRYYRIASDIYMQMGNTDNAKKSIEKGLALAGKMYQKDSNTDDPNLTLKVFWPSTDAYCSLLRQAAQISPLWALALLDEIDDREMKAAAEAAIAASLLKIPAESGTIMTSDKNGTSFSNSQRE